MHEGVLERSPTRGAVLLRRPDRLPLEMAAVAVVRLLWQVSGFRSSSADRGVGMSLLTLRGPGA